ncbi:MAG: glycerol kinase GlpK [Pseudomonadota bacterium]
MSGHLILGIDQGTTSSRAVLYDHDINTVASAQQEFAQIYPEPGWVEHDAEAIWESVVAVVQAALKDAGAGHSDVSAIGITNQRETTVVWDRQTGRPICNAIVWQDRRTADYCDKLRADGRERDVEERTGLRLDPYFSATKLRWILDNVDGARQRAEAGELAFGTIDAFLIWRLTGGREHVTDASNASRTLLFNIHTQDWDPALLSLFDIPQGLLPVVRDCADEFGLSDASLLGGEVPILGVAGDQQAALIGQAGFDPGVTKSTYGTGCFVIANTGTEPIASQNRLLTTVAYRLDGKVTYGIEGSVFVAGSAIQWLRDALSIIDSAPQTESIAVETGVVDDVYVVPAFAGLGAPYWDAHARGAILGLTRGAGRNEIVTATLQAIAYQSSDLLLAMADDGLKPSLLRVDGGMVANDWFLQFLADMLGLVVERPADTESTVLGAACLAALRAGILDDVADVGRSRVVDRVFEPGMDEDQRQRLIAGWRAAVARVSEANVTIS